MIDWRWAAKCRLLGGHPTRELFDEAVAEGEAAVPFFVDLLSRRELREGEPADAAFLPVHAMRVLGEIGSPAALPALLGVLVDPVDPGQDGEEAALALARIGEPAVSPLRRLAREPGRGTWVRAAAIQALAHAALRDRRLRPPVLATFRELLEDPEERDATLNAQVVDAAVRLAAEGLWPAIAGAYLSGRVDEDVVGAEAAQLELMVARHRPDRETKRLARRDPREDYASWEEAVDGLPDAERTRLVAELERIDREGAGPPSPSEDPAGDD